LPQIVFLWLKFFYTQDSLVTTEVLLRVKLGLRITIQSQITARNSCMKSRRCKKTSESLDQVEVFTSNRDRKGLLMAGADRAMRELMVIFKDDPIEIPLEEASMSIWAKMQLDE